MKRAAIFVTDHSHTTWYAKPADTYMADAYGACFHTSEQLLADLNKVLTFAVDAGITLEPSFAEAVSRVRAAIEGEP